jgi:hypothetical protein
MVRRAPTASLCCVKAEWGELTLSTDAVPMAITTDAATTAPFIGLRCHR